MISAVCVTEHVRKTRQNVTTIMKERSCVWPKAIKTELDLLSRPQLSQCLQSIQENTVLQVIMNCCVQTARQKVSQTYTNSNFGISGDALKWFVSYLKDREQQCMVNGKISFPKKTICGIPQGSIFCPLLFLLYINDMSESLNNTIAFLYADDTKIYA